MHPYDTLNVPQIYTAGSNTIFIQIFMDKPPGVPGVSKEPEEPKDYNHGLFLR